MNLYSDTKMVKIETKMVTIRMNLYSDTKMVKNEFVFKHYDGLKNESVFRN